MTAERFLGEPAEALPCLCGRTVRVWRHDRIVVLAHPDTGCGCYLGLDDPESFVRMLRARPPAPPSWRPVRLVITTAEASALAKAGKRVVALGDGWVEYGTAEETEDGSS